jgi:hypothetical protein
VVADNSAGKERESSVVLVVVGMILGVSLVGIYHAVAGDGDSCDSYSKVIAIERAFQGSIDGTQSDFDRTFDSREFAEYKRDYPSCYAEWNVSF